MRNLENAFIAYLSANLLFTDQTHNINTARQILSRGKLKHTMLSNRCEQAHELIPYFNDDAPRAIPQDILNTLSTEEPTLNAISIFTPALLMQRDHEKSLEHIHQIYSLRPTSSPLNYAATIMMEQIYRGISNQVSTQELFDILNPPKSVQRLDPKWWWILKQTMHILHNYSPKPALEFLNQSLHTNIPLTIESIEHPIWGLAYLHHESSKSTVLKDLEQKINHIQHGPAEYLGTMMWLFSPELFPPSWLKRVAKRQWSQKQTKTQTTQLRLFDDK